MEEGLPTCRYCLGWDAVLPEKVFILLFFLTSEKVILLYLLTIWRSWWCWRLIIILAFFRIASAHYRRSRSGCAVRWGQDSWRPIEDYLLFKGSRKLMRIYSKVQFLTITNPMWLLLYQVSLRFWNTVSTQIERHIWLERHETLFYHSGISFGENLSKNIEIFGRNLVEN